MGEDANAGPAMSTAQAAAESFRKGLFIRSKLQVGGETKSNGKTRSAFHARISYAVDKAFLSERKEHKKRGSYENSASHQRAVVGTGFFVAKQNGAQWWRGQLGR